MELSKELLLLLLQIKEKPKLSAEEARKQAEEVLRKAKEKREVRASACAGGRSHCPRLICGLRGVPDTGPRSAT